jgi:hypothetical protein
MTDTFFNVRGRAFFRISCWLYSKLLLLYPDDLYMRYGEEMQWVFREELKRAARHGLKEYLAMWCTLLSDTALQVGPAALIRIGIVSSALVGTLAMMMPVLSAIPSSFPKPDPPCLPRVYASSNMLQSTVSSGVSSAKDERRALRYLSYVALKTTTH